MTRVKWVLRYRNSKVHGFLTRVKWGLRYIHVGYMFFRSCVEIDFLRYRHGELHDFYDTSEMCLH